MNARELFRHWDGVREGLFQALDKTTDQQLHFTPREGLWTLGKVALHIAGAEEGWLRYVVQRELDDWPPEGTLGDYPTVAAVMRLLAEVHACTDAFLEGILEQDLERPIQAPWGESFPLRWVIWHVLEHEIHHRGEIYLMLGLLGMEAPDV